MAGHSYLSPDIADVVVQDYRGEIVSHEPEKSHSLTQKEREVVQLLAEGKRTKEIASRLYISPKTVESHRRRIMKKLGFHSIAELTKYAIQEGLTSIET